MSRARLDPRAALLAECDWVSELSIHAAEHKARFRRLLRRHEAALLKAAAERGAQAAPASHHAAVYDAILGTKPARRYPDLLPPGAIKGTRRAKKGGRRA